MICMELMDMSLHDLRLLVYERLKKAIPEAVLGKMAESVSVFTGLSYCYDTFIFLFGQTLKALIYLKKKLNVLHRGG